MNNKLIHSLLVVFLVLSFFNTNSAQSSVVIDGTRIVLNGVSNQVIHFKNIGQTPYIVQVAGDNYKQDKVQVSDRSHPPLIATPAAFKISGNGNQIVRLLLLQKNLPTDRESLFKLNFTQIPGLEKSSENQNQIRLILSSSVKVIYRPTNVSQFSDKTADKLSYHYSNGNFIISNDSPNILSINSIKDNNKKIAGEMTILPYNKYSLPLKNAIHDRLLTAFVLNDYGVSVLFKMKEK